MELVGVSGGTIASPTANATNITITTPDAFPTTYQLQVDETSSNGCVAQDVQAITVVNAPSPQITPATANQCQGNVVNYSTPLVGLHTYAWTVVGGTPASGTGNTISVTWNTVGNGSVTVVENNGRNYRHGCCKCGGRSSAFHWTDGFSSGFCVL